MQCRTVPHFARIIVNPGIREVVYKEDYPVTESALRLLRGHRSLPYEVAGRLTVVAALLLYCSHVALPCSCPVERPPCQAYGNYEAVFVGRASVGRLPRSFQDRRVRFSVEKLYRGVDKSRAEVLTSRFESMCGYEFRSNERYLVYAYQDKSGRLRVSSCSRTRPLADAKGDLAYLDSLPQAEAGARIFGTASRRPNEATDADAPWPPVEGVRIHIRGDTVEHDVLTDAKGQYEMRQLPAGRYHVEAHSPEYDNSSHYDVQIPDKGCALCDFPLRWDGRIRGRVIDFTGTPRVNVEVGVEAPYHPSPNSFAAWNLQFIVARTDRDGRYELQLLPPGRYRLKATLNPNRLPEQPAQIVWCPGALSPDAAAIVTLRPGQHIQECDLRLPSAR